MGKGYPDYEGEKSKLFTVADWAAVEATDKTFFGSDDDGDVVVDYAVPPGSKLYISYLAVVGLDSANPTSAQAITGYIQNLTTLETYQYIGGNMGASLPLNKPIVIDGGDTVRFAGTNWAGNEIWISAGGYEI